MTLRFAELMFTPTVKAVQERLGSRESYERVEEPDAPARDHFGDKERDFIALRDSFYMATVNEEGWPYVQHRGGPPGFLKVLDDRTLGFADYSGNRQYVSVGNLLVDDRVSLFLMDYPARRRLKILGRARLVDVSREPEMIGRLRDGDYDAQIERGMAITLEGFDWNCPQHITPRFTQEEVDAAVAPLLTRLRDAEARSGGLQKNEAAGEAVMLGSGPLELRIAGVRQLTPRVRAYELRAPDGVELPPVAAGSHLTLPVVLEDGSEAIRTYSISSNPARRDHYEIAVLREDQGGGGSRAVHRSYVIGNLLRCPMPRNAFPLHDDNRPALLIAGGIGITPLRAMADVLRAAGRPYHLHYAARSAGEAAYADDLRAAHGDATTFYFGAQLLDLTALFESAPDEAVAYVCGPGGLIDAVRAAAAALGWPEDRVRFERFVASEHVGGEPFTMVLARSNTRIQVAAEETALEALERAGVPIASSCRTGTCATCVVRVKAGNPDHRDLVLTPEERADGAFTTCVSRALGDELVLDL
jgi:ferredoxin-NADP reductase/predicted pyridoxine 5'-phosphate oxidase superfamily flavin-nucleotide-binding protein